MVFTLIKYWAVCASVLGPCRSSWVDELTKLAQKTTGQSCILALLVCFT